MVVLWQPKSYFGNSQFPHRTLIFSRSETHGSVEKCIFLRRMNSNFLMVSDLPDDGPEIRGGQPRYNIGDSVNVTCISRNSLPAAKLSWYINGEKADPIYLRTYPEETNIRTQLQTSTLGLTFKVNTKDNVGQQILTFEQAFQSSQNHLTTICFPSFSSVCNTSIKRLHSCSKCRNSIMAFFINF